MATFNQGSTDIISPVVNNVPNYNFLQSVYGIKQSQYDLGFSYLQNYTNSKLKGPLSNYDNIKHRNELFKKMEKSIRSVSGLDLSNQANIGKVMQIVEPISKDKELVWDSYLTSHAMNQSQILQTVKNSTDPKIKSKYNQYSEMYIQQNLQKLKAAKRGDGSILKMSTEDFDYVPFEDVIDHLNKSKKEQGINYENSVANNGYIYQVTNGKDAILPFSNWAFSQLKNSQFGKQFSVIAKVQLENNINAEMKSGLSREEAITKVASNLAPQLRVNFTDEGSNYQSLIDYYSTVINTVDEKYGGNIPDNLKEKYNTYIKLKKEAEDNLSSVKQNLLDLKENGISYMTSNLESIFIDQNYKNLSYNWAKGEAMANYKLEIKPDQLYISKMQIQADKELKLLAHKMSLVEINENYKNNYNLRLLDIQSKADIKGNKQSSSEGGKSSTTESGIYKADVVINNNKVYGLDLLDKDYIKSKDDIYNNTFNKGGLLDLISGGKFLNYYNAIQKLKSGKLDDNSKQQLIELNKTLNLNLNYDVSDKSVLNNYLTQLTSAIYTKAVAKANANKDVNLDNDNLKYHTAFSNVYSNLSRAETLRKQSGKNYKKVLNEVLDVYGNIKPEYKEITITDYDNEGPILDFSNLSKEKKTHLSKFLDVTYSDKNEMANPRYYVSDFPEEEIGRLFTPTNMSNLEVFVNDKKQTKEAVNLISNLSPLDFKDLIGNNGYIIPNASTNTLTLDLRVSPKSSTATKLKIKENSISNTPIPLKVVIPYSALYNSNGELRKIITRNTLGGVSNPDVERLNSDGGTINSPSYMDAMGFKYKISKVKDVNGAERFVIDMNVQGTSNNDSRNIQKYYGSPEDAIMDAPILFNTYITKKAELSNNQNGER